MEASRLPRILELKPSRQFTVTHYLSVLLVRLSPVLCTAGTAFPSSLSSRSLVREHRPCLKQQINTNDGKRVKKLFDMWNLGGNIMGNLQIYPST